MNALSIAEADAVYTCGSRCDIERHRVSHSLFQDYCISVGKFRKLAMELDTDEFWKPVNRAIRRVRFELNAFPAPFSQVLRQNLESLASAKKKLRRAPMLYPDLGDIASDIIGQLDGLAATDDCPLLDAVIELCGDVEESALLVKEARAVPIIQDAMAAKGTPIEVVVPQQLRAGARFESLVVAGPTKWYPDFVFTAPRANKVHVVHFAGIRDQWSSGPVFMGSRVRTGDKSENGKQRGRIPTETKSHGSPDALLFDPEDVLPEIDWEGVAQRLSVDSSSTPEETVIARLFLLEHGGLVLLDADDNARTSVVNLDELADSQVNRLPVSNIEPGMFVLLRIGRGGDYVVDVANRIMGNKATHARSQQRRWKDLLQSIVNTEGVPEVVSRLRAKGATHASDQNVRNWMSHRKIKPQDIADFVAITRLIGVEDESETLWKLMSGIDQAHKTAGQRIRKMLIQKIQQCDVWELQRLGRMDFSLPEVDGGICAIRVTGFHPDWIEVPASQIGQLLEEEGVEWQS